MLMQVFLSSFLQQVDACVLTSFSAGLASPRHVAALDFGAVRACASRFRLKRPGPDNLRKCRCSPGIIPQGTQAIRGLSSCKGCQGKEPVSARLSCTLLYIPQMYGSVESSLL
ncbi:hypothetical protein N657DRAFT_323345 [Parathielavia appendiculata]|uniref:Secreted protein n=1 Tax=Parathielavia appendiculata TaxID=2587402 RepID=A0AAN6TQT8_9PEZI|nr:hypothetical protein N657DRAFT_323345 [Parathielavia appendiculata]